MEPAALSAQFASEEERHQFLDRQPTYWLKRTYQVLRRRVDNDLRPLGISLSQRDALLALHHDGSMTLGSLADRLSLEQSSASRLVQGLERRGLLTARSDEADRRSRLISITSDGVSVLETTPGSSRLAGAILADVLSTDETEKLVSLLRRCAVALETASPDSTGHRRRETFETMPKSANPTKPEVMNQ